MEMMKIEQVVVGSERKSSVAEIKQPDPVVTPQYYPHESLQCFHCLIVFKDLKSKERHNKRNHRAEYTHQLQQSNMLFSCYKCSSCFSTSVELNRHQLTHYTEEKPFTCTLCPKRFSKFAELNHHKKRDCRKRRYLCKDCGGRFPLPSRLRKHRDAVHPEKQDAVQDGDASQCCKPALVLQSEEENEKTANCDFRETQSRQQACELTSSSQEVEVDKKIKESELQIPCSEEDCDLVFPCVEALRAHKKDLHAPRGLKAPRCEYTCLTCGESFAKESTLNAHQTSHIKTEQAVNQR